MLDYAALSALSAVLRTGSFEGAALSLGVTQSAISQRIKGLEERLGTALVRRTRPASATEAGARLLRHAENVGLLEAALSNDLGGLLPQEHRPVRIAVNADSLATWVLPALAQVHGLLYDVIVDDQDHSADWLRAGDVAGAITSHAAPIPGCNAYPLGALPYAATCAPSFFAQWFQTGITPESLAKAPALTYNRKDSLQERWVAEVTGQQLALPTHYLPSTHGFVEAAELGIGWGLNPLALAEPAIAAGRLVALEPQRAITTLLYWQVPRQMAEAMAPLSKALRQHAKSVLLQ